MANTQGAPIRGTASQRQPTRAESAAAIAATPVAEPANKPDQASTHPFMNPGTVELRRGLVVTTR